MTASPCAVVDGAKTGLRPFVIATLNTNAWRMVITIHDAKSGIALDVPVGTTHEELQELLVMLMEGKRPTRRRNKYHIGTEGDMILQAMKENDDYRSIVVHDVLREFARLKKSKWLNAATDFLTIWSPRPQTPKR